MAVNQGGISQWTHLCIDELRGLVMPRMAIYLLSFLFALLSAEPAAAKRVALLIGNGDYAKAGKLPNPARDATAVEKLLNSANFDVVKRVSDLGVAAMKRALRDFSDQARGADIAIVFYAGHGIEVNGVNHLIPVDAALERDIDVEDEAVPLERISQILEPVKGLRLIILDACRDNPFAQTMRRTIGSRSIGRGLAKAEPTMADTLIAYAAKAGSTAADGEGPNSPFTAALVKHLTTPGLDVRLAFGRIRDEVLKATANRQEPAVYGSLGGSEVSLVGSVKAVAAANTPAPLAQPQPADAERAWNLVKDTANAAILGEFINYYGATFYGILARARLEELKTAAEKQRHDLVIADYTKAIEINPKDSVGYRKRGIAYFGRQQYDLAIADYTKAIEIDPTNEATYYNRGLTYAAKRQYDVAIADYTKAIDINPKDALNYKQRGVAYFGKQQYDLAIVDHTKAIEINPKDASIYGQRGVAYYGKLQYDLAIADHSKSIELNPTNEATYYNRGLAYAGKRQYDRAIADYTQAIEFNPTDASNYQQRGTAHQARGDTARAVVDFQKSLQINPNNEMARAALASMGAKP